MSRKGKLIKTIKRIFEPKEIELTNHDKDIFNCTIAFKYNEYIVHVLFNTCKFKRYNTIDESSNVTAIAVNVFECRQLDYSTIVDGVRNIEIKKFVNDIKEKIDLLK